VTARSQARAADAAYADPDRVYMIGERVRTNAGKGCITHIAFSLSMDATVYTVQIDPRLSLRLLGRDLSPLTEKP
jgi:hypothetical protein